MKLAVIAALSAMLVAAPSQAARYYVGSVTKTNSTFADFDTFRVMENGHRQILETTILDGYEYPYMKTLVEYDCAKATMRSITSTAYDEHDKALITSGPGDVNPIIPGSVGSEMMSLVCRGAGPLEAAFIGDRQPMELLKIFKRVPLERRN